GQVDRDAEVHRIRGDQHRLAVHDRVRCVHLRVIGSARTTAYPIRWVKLTLPPRPRARWLLITIRLSARSLAGTARTLVAGGARSEASMCDTMRAATPRIGVVWAPAGAAGASAVSAFAFGFAGAAAETGAEAGAAEGAGAAGGAGAAAGADAVAGAASG